MRLHSKTRQYCVVSLFALVIAFTTLVVASAGTPHAPMINTPAASAPATTGPGTPSIAGEFPDAPRGYALVAGINDYPGTANDLSYCVPDANDVAGMLRDNGFAPGDVVTLLDGAATEPGISAAIASIAARMDGNDVFVMYYSGHGSYSISGTAPGTCNIHTPHPYPNNYFTWWTISHPGALAIRVRFDSFNVEYGYDIGFVADEDMYGYAYTGNRGSFWSDWILGDTIRVGIDSDYIYTYYGFDVTAYEVATSFDSSIITHDFATNGGMYGDELNAALACLPAGSTQFLAFDSCMSGGLLAPLSAPNRAVMTACAAGEYSYEDPALGHGVFTYFFLDAFHQSWEGHYDHDLDLDGRLSVDEIYAHAAPHARDHATSIGGAQHPQLASNIPGGQVFDLDADGDGLLNWEEMDTYHTNPQAADTDGDSLSDQAELMTYHTDPLLADSDGDGYDDGTEIQNGWDPNSWASPWGGIIAGIIFGVTVPAIAVGYGIYRHRHPVARGTRSSPYFPHYATTPSTPVSITSLAARSTTAPAYHSPDMGGRLVPVFKGHAAPEWSFLATALEARGRWDEALAAAEIARQLRRAEMNPPAWVRAENARAAGMVRRPSLPSRSTSSSTPVIDSFLAEPSPAPADLRPIPQPEPPAPTAPAQEEVWVPPVPAPAPASPKVIPLEHPDPAPELIPLCGLCGGLVRNGECVRCSGKVCPRCGAANYAVETACQRCHAPL